MSYWECTVIIQIWITCFAQPFGNLVTKSLLEQHCITWFLHNTQLSSSIKQSPLSEANMSSPSQETPHILWKGTAFTSLHPEPYQSNPCLSSTSWRSISIVSSSLCKVFQVVIFLQVSPPKPCMHLLCLPYMLHVPLTLFFLIFCEGTDKKVQNTQPLW